MKRSSLVFSLFVLLIIIFVSGCNIIEPGSDLDVYGVQADEPVFNPPEGKYNVPSIAVEISSPTKGATIFYAFEEDIPHGIDTWVFALQSLNRLEVDNCASLFYNPTGERTINEIISISDCYNIFFDLNQTLPGGAYTWLYELEGVTKRTVDDCLDLFNAQTDTLDVVNIHIGDCYKVFDALNESVTNELDSWLYTGPFTLTNDTQISAVSYVDGMDPSDLVTVNYDITWVPPPDNIHPSINITHPINKTFFGEEDIEVKTIPTDVDGNVTKVEFIKHVVGIDWELLGTVTEEPYDFTIKNISEENFILEAIAYDDVEDSNSSKIEIEVLSKLLAPKENNTPPNVTFIAPEEGDSFEPGDVVWLKTIAVDADGLITKVEFFEDGTLIGSDESRPFNFAWDAVTEDSYIFSAKATDSDGASSITEHISITVARKFSNKKPGVNFVRPKDRDHFVTNNISLEATASDPDGYIERVEFYRDETVLLNMDLTKPFLYYWENVGAGEYTVLAKTYDFEGGVGESKPITITVNPTTSATNDLPNVSIYSPSNFDTFIAGKIVPIVVNATDNKSIKNIEYLFNGKLIGEISMIGGRE